jgi:hypothetical protein
MPKVTGRNSVIRKTVLTIAAFSFLQLAVCAQSPDVTIVSGQTGLVGLAQGEMLRFTAFNPAKTEGGHDNEALTLRLIFYDHDGNVIKESPVVTIPPGGFRSVDTLYDDLPIAADGTARKQVRTVPLWGLRAKGRILVSVALDLVQSATGAGEFRFFFTVEALP